jgi:hypothetical protein
VNSPCRGIKHFLVSLHACRRTPRVSVCVRINPVHSVHHDQKLFLPFLWLSRRQATLTTLFKMQLRGDLDLKAPGAIPL